MPWTAPDELHVGVHGSKLSDRFIDKLSAVVMLQNAHGAKEFARQL